MRPAPLFESISLDLTDLFQSLTQLIETKHCGIRHKDADDNRTSNMIPNNLNAIDLCICATGSQSENLSDNHYQQIGRHLVPGQLLNHLSDNVRDDHQTKNDRQDDTHIIHSYISPSSNVVSSETFTVP